MVTAGSKVLHDETRRCTINEWSDGRPWLRVQPAQRSGGSSGDAAFRCHSKGSCRWPVICQFHEVNMQPASNPWKPRQEPPKICGTQTQDHQAQTTMVLAIQESGQIASQTSVGLAQPWVPIPNYGIWTRTTPQRWRTSLEAHAACAGRWSKATNVQRYAKLQRSTH